MRLGKIWPVHDSIFITSGKTFGASAPINILMDKYGFTAENGCS